MNLYKKVVEGLGPRRKNLTEDQYQIFWIGVLKAYKTADHNRDIIPYLVLRGLGEVKNHRRSEFSNKYFKICPKCNTTYGFRADLCKNCGSELNIDARHFEYEDSSYHEPDITDKIVIEEFICTLSGRKKYIAKRWLVDRADLMYDNHLKQIGFELGISAVAVSNHKKRIKQEFLKWYHR